MIKFLSLPFPPSMNSNYMPSGRRLVLSPEARAFKMDLDLELSLNHTDKKKMARDLKGKPLIVFIDYIGSKLDWFTQDGKIRKIDVDSRHKSFVDVVFKFLSLDDSQIFLHKTSKKTVKQCKERHVEMSIGEYCIQNNF
ncbi:MAG: hypothetical protein ACXU9U_05475 [Parachlamydiaceae bacterium]